MSSDQRLPPPPPMPADLRARLAAARATRMPTAEDPPLVINDVIAHSANADGSRLRTRPEVLSVFLREAYSATCRSELQDGFRVAAQRMHRSGAFKDFTLETRPAPGMSPLHAGDIHLTAHEGRFSANTGVTRSSTGTIEWVLEAAATNAMASAETLSFKLAHRKHDFSVTEAAAGIRDHLGSAGGGGGGGSGGVSASNPLSFFPSYELALSKPTMFDTPCVLDVVVRGETVDHTGKCGFSNKIQEAEVGVSTPSLRHKVSYLCSWRNILPLRHPKKHFTCATAAPVVANADSSLKSSVQYRFRDDTRPLMAVPTSGRLAEVVAEWAGVGGDVQFGKVEARTQHHWSFWRHQPDTGFQAPAHRRAQYEAAKKAKTKPDEAFLHPDPAQRGLKPHPGPAMLGVRKLTVADGGKYSWADRLAGWLSPGVTVAVSGSAGYVRPFGADAYRKGGTRLADRFFLGGPEMTGFDKFGVGPRAEPVVGGNPAGDALGGDFSLYSSLRVYLPPIFPSVRLANFGMRTELFACAGVLTPRPTTDMSVLSSNLSASVGAALVIPLLSSVSLQAQAVLHRHGQERDVRGTLLALVSLW